MKTCCKDVDILDRDIITKYTWRALEDKKLRRRDYSSFVSSYSDLYSARQIQHIAEDHMSKELLQPEIDNIVDEVMERFYYHDLDLPPIVHKERIDGISKKVRIIAIEHPLQQVIEHVLVGLFSELWDRKIVYHQYASIQGKGQLAGAKQIARWAQEDDYEYFVKLDIRKCFPSFRHDIIMDALDRDCHKNPELLDLAEAIISTHGHGGLGLVDGDVYFDEEIGLEIGSLFSQYICNYVVSYIYRYIESLCRYRRDKRIPYVKHQLWFMDDCLLEGASRNNLLLAVNHASDYIEDVWGLNFKQNWHIKNHDLEPINMMGYKIYRDGTIKIKDEVFIRARRCFNNFSTRDISQARSVTSRYGYFKHTGVNELYLPNGKRIDIQRVQDKASSVISEYDRKE